MSCVWYSIRSYSMYLRLSKVRRGERTYRYAQLVESFRRPDGTPTNRVLASLGRLDDSAVAQVRAILAVARGDVPVLPEVATPARHRVHLSLRYLDLAVLLSVWRDAGLHDLVRAALGDGPDHRDFANVLAALVLQRAVAPSSKLAASRWYPTSSLPELLGLAPRRFNNSRVHRALTALDRAEPRLQRALPDHLAARHGGPTAILIDATDTWFVGQGPPMAAKGKDKEGLFRRRIGIVLLCDQRGVPLRWHTLDGRYHDATALAAMADEVAHLPWAAGVPVVVDRALGHGGWLDKLDKLGLHFVTCVPASELQGCGAQLPWQDIDEWRDIDEPQLLAARAEAAGFVRVHDRRYVLDVGLFDKARPRNADRSSRAVAAMDVLELLESPASAQLPRSVLAKQLGISERALQRHTVLKQLTAEVRQRIRQGEADTLNFARLHELARVTPEQQLVALAQAVAQAPDRRLRAPTARCLAELSFPARGALALNPVRLIEDRKADEEALARVRRVAKEVNRALASPSSRRTDASALAAVHKAVRRGALGHVCTVQMENSGDRRTVLVDIDEGAWQRRRRTDGLALIVTHPAVEGTAAERVQRYFSRDAIEKDFQSIKSVLGLRPVRHRTDEKLRAHVTICVLALVLQRILEARLEQAGHPTTMAAMVGQLAPVHLSLLGAGKTRYYTVTKPDKDSTRLLRALGLDRLVKEKAVAEEITPR